MYSCNTNPQNQHKHGSQVQSKVAGGEEAQTLAIARHSAPARTFKTQNNQSEPGSRRQVGTWWLRFSPEPLLLCWPASLPCRNGTNASQPSVRIRDQTRAHRIGLPSSISTRREKGGRVNTHRFRASNGLAPLLLRQAVRQRQPASGAEHRDVRQAAEVKVQSSGFRRIKSGSGLAPRSSTHTAAAEQQRIAAERTTAGNTARGCCAKLKRRQCAPHVLDGRVAVGLGRTGRRACTSQIGQPRHNQHRTRVLS